MSFIVFGEFELYEYTPKVLAIPTVKSVKDSATTKIQPDTDKDPEEPILGDEEFGAATEIGIPEDPTEEYRLPVPKLIYANRNPRTPCPECRPYIGTVWQLGNQPRVPRHEGCYCFYQHTYQYETKNRPRFPHKPENIAHMDAKVVRL